jgi:hypothetical protein
LVGVALGTALPVVLLEPMYLRTAIREIGVDGRRFLATAVLRPFAAAAVGVVPLLLVVAVGGDVGLLQALTLSLGYAVLFALVFSRVGVDEEDRRLLRRVLRRPLKQTVGENAREVL